MRIIVFGFGVVLLLATVARAEMRAQNQTSVVPAAHFASDARTHEAWVIARLNAWINNSAGGPPPKNLIDQRRHQLERMPPGTYVFVVPGVIVEDGAVSSSISDAAVVHTALGFAVYKRGVLYGNYSANARVIATPALYEYYVAPGHKIPQRFIGTPPASVAR